MLNQSNKKKTSKYKIKKPNGLENVHDLQQTEAAGSKSNQISRPKNMANIRSEDIFCLVPSCLLQDYF